MAGCQINQIDVNFHLQKIQNPIPKLQGGLKGPASCQLGLKKKLISEKNGPHFLICFKRGSFFYFRAAAEKSTFSTDETERLGLLPSRQNYTLLDLVR